MAKSNEYGMNDGQAIAASVKQSQTRIRSIRSLAPDRRGSSAMMMAAALIPTIAAFGSAIDAGRMYVVKSQLQAGVDAAALAGARAFGITDTSANGRLAQANAYFSGNFSTEPAYMGVTELQVLPTFETLNGINVTTVTASATVPMTFMRIFGISDQVMTAVAKAELQPRPLEAMMVLDNTGSMKANLSGGRTRITALKEAASDFVDILYQGSTARRDLALGILPYDITVNVGRLLPSNSVEPIDGFNSGLIYYGGDWPTNRYAWKGCVMNDSTVRNLTADRTISEPGAWDVTRTLPGRGGNPKVQPFFVPPMYVPLEASSKATAASKASPTSDFYKKFNSEPSNNLYRLDDSAFGETAADYLANSDAYRQFFYDYYIGLNNGAGSSGDDVIVTNGGGYFNPGSNGNWAVNWKRIPRYSDSAYFKNPTSSIVNKDGGRVDSGSQNTTDAPSPNWQCPEEALLPVYGRSKNAYTDYIRDKNAAIYPANGTIHHSGLLWGYRLLVRDDVFKRSNPTNEQPRRAIVFMTDGLNEVGESQNGYTDRTFTWYGRWSDATLSTKASDAETQMLRRFSKTCANIQREDNPPEVYIIALVANSAAVDTAFNDCAPGRVYRTSSTDELRKAFQDVASELVDLHLIQ